MHSDPSPAANPLETALQQVPFLSHLTDGQIAEVARAGATTTMDAGRVIFHEGDAGDRVYVILSGSVRIVGHDDEGHEVVVATLGPGAFFGEIALLDGGPRTAGAVTLEACTLFALERTAFFNLLAQAPPMLAGIFTNLTAMVRQNMERFLQEEIAARTMRAEMELARHRALSQMVAGVAHEVNTPLGTANTAASLVKRALAPEAIPALARDAPARATLEEVVEAVVLIERNIVRAHRLVEDFKKVSVSQITATRERLNLAEAVGEIVGLFRISAKQARLDLRIHDELPAGEGDWEGYLGYLTQVITNLLTNVERYAYPAGAGGRVDIVLAEETHDSEQQYIIRVRDYGAGIPAEHLGRVFDAFFTTGRGRGGTGLGMAIVYNLVTVALKGAIAVESTPGEGTEVRISLPRTVPEDRGTERQLDNDDND